jgi:threonine synthase
MDGPIKRIQKQAQQAAAAAAAAANLKQDNEGASKPRIVCGVNSYNIGRPLMQMVHFIWTYLRVVEDLNVSPGDPSKFCFKSSFS